MIIDSQLQFSAAQALTATAVSTNAVDLGTDRDIGVGKPMCVVITLSVAADATDGNETYQADLQTDSTSAFGAPVVLGSATITRGDKAGTKYIIPVPADKRPNRWLRMNYPLGGTTPSVTLSAELQPMDMVQNDSTFPKGYTIS